MPENIGLGENGKRTSLQQVKISKNFRRYKY
jgi:hypothetical protein